MKVDAKFISLVQASCEAALTNHGFRRLRRDGVVYELSDDFLGWVGLNVGKHDGFVRINPFVGIHCVSIMQLVAKLSGESYQLGRYATFAIHLGKICPEEDSFEFHLLRAIEPEAERLATIYQKCGIPFMISHANYESVLFEIEKRSSTFGGYPQRMVAALYLMGRVEDAVRFVSEFRRKCKDDPAVQQSFERFADPFMKLIAS